MQHAARNMQHAARSMQHATCNMQHATRNMQHAWCTAVIERLTDGRLDVHEIAVEAVVLRKATQRLDRPLGVGEQCGCVGDARRVRLGDERAEARETAPLASAPWTTTRWLVARREWQTEGW